MEKKKAGDKEEGEREEMEGGTEARGTGNDGWK